ncbi:hypothetical protein N7466_007549 [Penicillium verhagenii]|uniref:uncharacterized protein n=1 Tax=Penicillium verhagenii TaxID=1562060 RepID=UPI002544D99D|nr:uncharacterized protein N7466_007549 [Penicillium verhagenii]KAJ5928593.1 hypothetical protein N7466_007549 [Penicillium verhagenii]
MSTPDESPAQKAARLRRERREAKIRDGGSARLDKITSLSGRTPQSEREEGSPSPQPPRNAVSPSPPPFQQNQPSMQDQQSIEALQAQQDAFRAMLRQAAPVVEENQDATANDLEDPTLKLLNSLLNGMPMPPMPGNGDPNAPPPPPGFGGGMPGQGAPGPGLSSAALIASSLGLPPFVANLVGEYFQTTEEDPKSVRTWKTLHVLFALGVAFYLLFIIGASIALFGSPPPKPATVQNPFVIFVTGELLLCGGRVLVGGQKGLRAAIKIGKDVVRDGSLVVFALGLGSWYTRDWQVTGGY